MLINYTHTHTNTNTRIYSIFSRQSHAVTTPTTDNQQLPNSEVQQNFWATTNESLIAPQLLLVTEPKTTIIPTTSNNNDNQNNQNKNNNNNNNNNINNNFNNNNNNNLQEIQITDTESSNNNMEINSSSITTTTTTIQAPKSPPRWPLRPGVMLHVNRDTKQNLAVNRMTLKPELTQRQSSSNNTSIVSGNSGVMLTSSPLLTTTLERSRPSRQSALNLTFNMAATLPLRGKKPRLNEPVTLEEVTTSQSEINEIVTTAESTSDPVIVTERLHIKPRRNASKFEQRVEQILASLFRRGKGKHKDSTRDSQRSHVELLSGMFFGRRRDRESEFDTKHRLKGIRCSGSGNA